MKTTVTITMPEEEYNDLRFLVNALKHEKEKRELSEDLKAALELVKLAALDSMIESLNDAHHNH